MKPAIYGGTAGVLSPLILMAFNYLPVNEEKEFESIIACIVVGLSLGLLLKLSEVLYAKMKQK